jgi:hypothetical protein
MRRFAYTSWWWVLNFHFVFTTKTHPNVVKLLETIENEKQMSIVMENANL